MGIFGRLFGGAAGKKAAPPPNDENYQRALRILDNWELIHRMDPGQIANDPKAQRLIRGMSELPYQDIAQRAGRLLDG